MNPYRLFFQRGAEHLCRTPTLGEYLAAGKRELIGRYTRLRVQPLLTQRVHHAPDVAPKDRPRAHWAGFGACVEGAGGKFFGGVGFGGQADQICFRVAGAVAFGDDGVFGAEEDAAFGVREERAERMVAVFPREAGEFDGFAEEGEIGFSHGLPKSGSDDFSRSKND